ncbi:MAG TPA: MFS transporter [Methylorubrum populi]|uniref:MFS transporter n=1 Tax=Methylorubrum populi TaxID=223967 RepID=A0A921E040_9HYPH|nr:MFS transporter [Methylorubrum populi]
MRAEDRVPPLGLAGFAALVLLQLLVTAAPLALLPFLGLHLARMSAAPAFWTAAALAAPAVTTLAMTPAWTGLARVLSLPSLIVWTGIFTAASCAIIAVASDPVTLLAGRLVQGLAGGGVVLALAFRAAGRSAGRGFAAMQQAVAAGCLLGPLVGGFAFEREQLGLLMLGFGGLILVATSAAAASRDLSAEPDEESPSGRADSSDLSLLCAGLCGSAGAFAFVAFFPAWANAYDPALYTPGLIGLLHSLSWLVALLVLPLWARVMDGVSPVAALNLSLIGCALGFAAVPLGVGLAGIVALRLLQGALFAGQAPALFAAVEAVSPSRTAAMARARASLTLGQLVGPFVAGLALVPLGPSGALFAAAGLSFAGAVALATAAHPLRTIRSRAR